MSDARPLELLHRRAEVLGAIVTLSATNDAIDETTGNRPYSRLDDTQLIALAVVRPLKSGLYSRSMQIARGHALVTAQISDARLLDEAAMLLVGALDHHLFKAAGQ